MRHDEYIRLQAGCLDMAKQACSPEEQARWLAMAQEWWRCAEQLREARRSASPTASAGRRP
jgi:hypothetical protein